MPWFKVDDSFHSHPKALATDPAALGLWVLAGSWSSAHLTEGFVRDDVLPRLLPDAAELAKKLVASGLWKRVRGGYQFHDWLDKNPSRQAVEKDRAGKAARQKRWREGQRRRVTSASSNDTSYASKDGAPPRPAPKEAGRAMPSPGDGASGRAHPSGSAVRAVPNWCGECDERTRQVDPDAPRRCPTCHPLRGQETA